jgi:N,N-dimethylformamidase
VLIGFVSDENYVALAGVDLEFENEAGSTVATSRASGSIYADIAPGHYRVALSKPGFSAKRVEVDVHRDDDATFAPLQFRLLSNQLVGFMWPKWVRSGDVSEYCVNSNETFKLELWRYAWEKEFVRSFGWCGEHGPRAMNQILPDTDFTQSGVDWNRVGYNLEFQKHGITAPEKSGLYFLHAKTQSGAFCSFPWIVSPQQPQSDVCVLTSNITWNAYNNFGGRSNYFNQDGLPARPIVNSRQDVARYTSTEIWPFEETGAPLSFQRPETMASIPEDAKITDPIQGRMTSAFAPGEWRLLGWLEREGFGYDLYSETELHFGGFSLDDYKVLVLNNHSEYWSAEMYARVKKWVFEQGGKLMYLGGCGLYAEVEFTDESTMLCRREGEFDQRGESPAALLGIEYTHGGFQTGAPYRVINDEHWAIADTGLKKGDLFGHESLHERCPGGASAHETDKIAATSPSSLVHLAKGDNPDGEGADLVIFDTASGGSVFSVGSFCWTLSLPIDDRVSSITTNVLRRFLSDHTRA